MRTATILPATCGDRRAALTTTWTPLNEPTGWMSGTLPATLPQELAVTGSATVATPTGLQQREVANTILNVILLAYIKFPSADTGADGRPGIVS